MQQQQEQAKDQPPRTPPSVPHPRLQLRAPPQVLLLLRAAALRTRKGNRNPATPPPHPGNWGASPCPTHSARAGGGRERGEGKARQGAFACSLPRRSRKEEDPNQPHWRSGEGRERAREERAKPSKRGRDLLGSGLSLRQIGGRLRGSEAAALQVTSSPPRPPPRRLPSDWVGASCPSASAGWG